MLETAHDWDLFLQGFEAGMLKAFEIMLTIPQEYMRDVARGVVNQLKERQEKV